VNTDDNKAVIRKMYTAVDAHEVDVIEQELLDPAYQFRFDSMPLMDRAGAAQFFRAFVAGFPNISLTIEDMIAEGDRVVLRQTYRGTHQGEMMGIPPTGRPVTLTAIDIVRVADGKLAEHWSNNDQLGMLQQLGVIPAPGQPAA